VKRSCIAIIDASRARIYTYEQEHDPADQLREVSDLVNPGRRLLPHAIFADTRPGERGRVRGQLGHAVDDHRDAHYNEMDAQFGKDIVATIARVVRAGSYAQLIVVASPPMLGVFRKAGGVLHARNGLQIHEVVRDLVKLTSAQLHDHLAQLRLIPPRERPGAHDAAR
jgi:protein required for attachment to host cells